ncbi:MAG TPA: ribosome-associated translation inhibitor RaiA [Alphaproteobacteria bacterium]|nr:ribosome-associated translation inhibitor RaiA [Alphaproteobacteria bacterium]
MKITVSGKQMKVGAALRQHVLETADSSIKKYFENAISADVHFSKEVHLFVTDIIVNDGTGTQYHYKSQAKEENVYASFDKALDRMEKQLRRYKRRIKDHHKTSLGEAAAIAATKYVITDDGQDFEEENTEDAPLIIAEKQTMIETLTVADAVMRMNLSNLPALMFINKKTGSYNVVYKRLDGNISWVEAQKQESSKPQLKAVN